MGAALIVATQINFKYDLPSEQPVVEPVKAPQEPTREEYLQQQLAQQLNLPSLADTTGMQTGSKEPNVGKVSLACCRFGNYYFACRPIMPLEALIDPKYPPCRPKSSLRPIGRFQSGSLSCHTSRMSNVARSCSLPGSWASVSDSSSPSSSGTFR